MKYTYILSKDLKELKDTINGLIAALSFTDQHIKQYRLESKPRECCWIFHVFYGPIADRRLRAENFMCREQMKEKQPELFEELLNLYNDFKERGILA